MWRSLNIKYITICKLLFFPPPLSSSSSSSSNIQSNNKSDFRVDSISNEQWLEQVNYHNFFILFLFCSRIVTLNSNYFYEYRQIRYDTIQYPYIMLRLYGIRFVLYGIEFWTIIWRLKKKISIGGHSPNYGWVSIGNHNKQHEFERLNVLHSTKLWRL